MLDNMELCFTVNGNRTNSSIAPCPLDVKTFFGKLAAGRKQTNPIVLCQKPVDIRTESCYNSCIPEQCSQEFSVVARNTGGIARAARRPWQPRLYHRRSTLYTVVDPGHRQSSLTSCPHRLETRYSRHSAMHGNGWYGKPAGTPSRLSTLSR